MQIRFELARPDGSDPTPPPQLMTSAPQRSAIDPLTKQASKLINLQALDGGRIDDDWNGVAVESY